MKKKLSLIAIIIFVGYFIIFYLFPNFLLALELRVFDQLTVFVKDIGYFLPKLHSSIHLDDIIIVAIDDATIIKLQKRLPLPRYIYADLLKKIYNGNPKLIVFDIVFSGQSEDRKSDALLAKAIKGKDNILFPYARSEFGRSLESDRFFIKDFASAGYINKPLDIDSAVRRIRPIDLTIENNIRDYATELYIFSRYYDYDLGDITTDNKSVKLNNLKPKKTDNFHKFNFSLGRDSAMWIKYQESAEGFHKIPMWSVLSDDFNPEIFKDKIVFVGATAKVFHDIYNTPLRIMSGVEIMVNVTLMFLDGKFIEEAPRWLRWLVIFIFCLLTVFIYYRIGIIKGALFTISLVSIMLAATFGLFLNNYYFNPFKLVLICIISYIVINFYKYAYVVIENIQLRRISTTDELTGLNTFRLLQVVIDHEFQKCLRYKANLSLLMIDIDNFKSINDTHGHQNGNVVLRKIGKIILDNVRKSDFPTRYGGEELAVLLPNSDIEGALKCAENIRQLIEKENYFMTKQGPLKVTVSIGLSSSPAMNITSPEDMIKFADTALYKAKHQGKNRTIVYSEEI